MPHRPPPAGEGARPDSIFSLLSIFARLPITVWRKKPAPPPPPLQVATPDYKSINSSTCKVCITGGFKSRGCSSPFTRLADHHTALLRLVPVVSVWSSVKTRRGPSRHCRDSRVYGPTTTVRPCMAYEYTSPRRPLRAPRRMLLRYLVPGTSKYIPGIFLVNFHLTSHDDRSIVRKLIVRKLVASPSLRAFCLPPLPLTHFCVCEVFRCMGWRFVARTKSCKMISNVSYTASIHWCSGHIVYCWKCKSIYCLYTTPQRVYWYCGRVPGIPPSHFIISTAELAGVPT